MLAIVQLSVIIMITSVLVIISNSSRLDKEIPGLKKLLFHTDPSTVTAVLRAEISLTCKVQGIPNPTIRWLKDGMRMGRSKSSIIPSRSNKTLDLSSTVSKLYFHCITEQNAAVYTCVAETPLTRIVQNHTVIVDCDRTLTDKPNCTTQRSVGYPARIYMYTDSKIEYAKRQARLYCRADGSPRPNITWFDNREKPLATGKAYKFANNGDLIVNKVTKNYNFICRAKNALGYDRINVTLTPYEFRTRGKGH